MIATLKQYIKLILESDGATMVAASGPPSSKKGGGEKEKMQREYAGSDDPIDWIEAARKSPKVFDDYLEPSIEDQSYSAMASAARAKSLPHLGRGSSRDVYGLDSARVVKLARNEAGKDQNGDEAAVSHNPEYGSIIARVLDRAKDNSWIVVEKCEIIKSPAAFKATTGTDWNEFIKALGVTPQMASTSPLSGKKAAGAGEKGLTPELEDFVKKAKKMVAAHEGMMVSDMAKPDSLGTMPNGDLVFVDYGVSEKTFEEKYSGGRYVPKSKRKEGGNPTSHSSTTGSGFGV